MRQRVVFLLVIAYLFQATLERPVSQANLLFMLRYDALILGALIYFMDRDGLLAKIRLRLNYSNVVIVILVLCLAGLIVSPVLLKNFYAVTFVDLFAGLFVLTSIIYAKELSNYSGTLTNASLWLAERSYTLYLSHKPCMFLAHLVANELNFDILPASLLDLRWLPLLAFILFASHLCYNTSRCRCETKVVKC